MALPRLLPLSKGNWAVRSDGGAARETWGQRRYGVMPRNGRGYRRSYLSRPGARLLQGVIALPIGALGLWLSVATLETHGQPATPPATPPLAVALVFQVPPPGLTILVDRAPEPLSDPEAWGSLPSTAAGPVAAMPLADTSLQGADATRCRDVPTLAGQMTCIDPTLREAERRMVAAYEAMLAAGVSPSALGRSQARWLAARDAAAKSSPEDLLATYQHRERQLRSAAAALERQAAQVGLSGPSQATLMIPEP